MSNRSDNKVLPHHNLEKQKSRMKINMLRAKITWSGKLTYEDRERLLKYLDL